MTCKVSQVSTLRTVPLEGNQIGRDEPVLTGKVEHQTAVGRRWPVGERHDNLRNAERECVGTGVGRVRRSDAVAVKLLAQVGLLDKDVSSRMLFHVDLRFLRAQQPRHSSFETLAGVWEKYRSCSSSSMEDDGRRASTKT